MTRSRLLAIRARAIGESKEPWPNAVSYGSLKFYLSKEIRHKCELHETATSSLLLSCRIT